MVRLMIEHMQHRGDRRLFVMKAFTIRIRQPCRQETRGGVLKEGFHCDVILLPRDSQYRKFSVKNRVEGRRGLASARKARHPDPVSKQAMVQEGMNAAE